MKSYVQSRTNRHPELVSGSIATFTLLYGGQAESDRQINPMWVMLVDKVNLPWTMPVFQLFFACNGAAHVSKHFEMNEARNIVFRGKSIRVFIAVLIQSLQQIGRHADIKRAIMLARQNIDAGLFFVFHCSSDALKWTLKQVQGDGICQVSGSTPTQRHPEFISGSIVRFIHMALKVSL